MKSRGIFANTVFTSVERLFFAASSLVLVPIAISQLGLSLYGIWVLLIAVASYFSLAQFGFSSSFEKYIAEFRALNDRSALDAVVCTGFYTLLGISGGIFVLGSLLSPLILRSMAGNAANLRYVWYFVWYLGLSCISLSMQIFFAVPRGFMRFDVSSMISMGARAFEFAISIALLYHSFGIESLLWAATVSTAIACSGNIVASSLFLNGKLPVNPRHFDWLVLKKMYRFGITLQMSYFAAWVTQNFDKLILGWMLNASATALYDIGAKLVSLLKQISWMLFAVIVPKASEIHARDGIDNLKKMYLTGTRFLTVLCVGSVGLFFPFAPIILGFWLRRTPNPGSVEVFRILLVGIMLNVTAGIGSSIVKGMGKPEIETISNSLMASFNIILSFILCRTTGLDGVAWGTGISAVGGAVILYGLVNKRFGIANFDFFGKTFTVPLLVNAILVLGGLVVLRSVHIEDAGGNAGIVAVSVYGVVAILGSVALYSRLGYLTYGDAQKIWRS